MKNKLCLPACRRVIRGRAEKIAVLFFPLAFLFFAAGCGGRTIISGGRSAENPLICPDCNVILVSLDTLRADSLGTYGCARDTSPNMDRLARKGAVFINTYSHAPSSFPSHMSIFTSQYPWTHKVITILKDRLAPETVTLPMLFQEHGYRTVWAAPPDNPYLSLEAGFKKGFDDFIEPAWYPDDIVNPVFKWLSENTGRKFFMFLHTYRIHAPYLPERSSLLRFMKAVPPQYMSRENLYDRVWKTIAAEPSLVFSKEVITANPGIFSTAANDGKAAEIESFVSSNIELWQPVNGLILNIFLKSAGQDPSSDSGMEYLRTLYDAGVFEADRAVGALYEKLEELGLADKTLLVVTSDHGDEFMEHGGVSHNKLYQECLHVPLIFVFPGKQIGKRISRTAQSIDIAPTILEAAGIPGLPKGEGRSLLPLIAGDDSGGRNPLAFAGPWGGKYSARDSRYTYLVKNNCADNITSWNPACLTEELYDRTSDPLEVNNIFSANKAAAAAFSSRLYKKIKSAGKGSQYPWQEGISEEAKKKILDTGYW